MSLATQSRRRAPVQPRQLLQKVTRTAGPRLRALSHKSCCVVRHLVPRSNDVIGFQLTRPRIGKLYLYCRMRDFEFVMQLIADLLQKGVAGMTARHNQVTR